MGQREPLTFDRLAAALFFLGVACAACFMPAQSDTWWHLRAGEEIWRLHRVPLRDSFSHTAYGGYWPDHEWLTQVIFYGLYRLGGLKLLTAVMAAFVTATWMIVWRLTPGNFYRRLLLAGLALVPSSIAWSLRPQVFTLFLLALTANLLTKRKFWWLPPIFLVWANLHGAVLLGIVLLVVVTAGTALTDRRQGGRLLVVTLLSVLATCITPLGLSFWSEMSSSLGRINQAHISEWRAPQLADPVFLPFWLLAVVLVTMAVVNKPWRSFTLFQNVAIAGALALAPLALGAGRNVPPLMLLAVPAIAMLMDAYFGVTQSSAARGERASLNAVVLVAAAVVGIGSVVYAWTREIDRLQWHPLPADVIAAVAACPENLYNRYDEGGYLMWFVPGQKVFLDGRQDPYPPALVQDQIRAEASGDYGELFHRYGIRCAIVVADSPIAQRLSSDGWRAVNDDAHWAVMTSASNGRGGN